MIDKGELIKRKASEIRGLIEDLETLGLYNPINKVFCDLPHSSYFALFYVIFAIATIPKMFLLGNQNNTKTMFKRLGNHRIDGLPILYGLVTIFKQYNSSLMDTFLEYYSVYIKSSVVSLARYECEMVESFKLLFN